VVATLIVLPTYPEATNIVTVLQRIRSVLPDADVLVVDDGSPDGTADLAEATGRERGRITVMRRAAKSGLGSAYRAGFAHGLAAGADVLVEMDADLSHDPAALPSLVAPAQTGEADLVIGSRYVPGGSIPDWPLHRRALSQWGNRYAAAMLRLRVADATAGFRAYRADTLRAIDLDTVSTDGYGFQIDMAYRVRRAGGRIVEIPIEFHDRVRGTSKMSWRIIVEALAAVTWWGVRDRLKRDA
jgi:glycosyltransferase involved in cell wall biosynthesis